MKILLLIAGSRSGSDFFHSLLDGHSQILQFPGYLNINKNFYNIFNLNNPKEISLAPAEIENILYGIGVKPAVKIIINPCCSKIF